MSIDQDRARLTSRRAPVAHSLSTLLALVALCATPHLAWSRSGQDASFSRGSGAAVTTTGRRMTLETPPTSTISDNAALDVTPSPSDITAQGTYASRFQEYIRRLGEPCENCSTVGGGSGGGGSGATVITKPPPQPLSSACKPGEELIVLSGVPKCA